MGGAVTVPVDLGEVIGDALVILGAALLVIASLGVALPSSGVVRLHYLSLAALVGAPVCLAGVLVRDPTDWFKICLIAVLIAVTSPVTGVATARALRRPQGEHR